AHDAPVGGDEPRVGAEHDVADVRPQGGRVVDAPGPDRQLAPQGVDAGLVAVPPREGPPGAGGGDLPGDADAGGALGEVLLELPLVAADGARRRAVVVGLPDEGDTRVVGDARPDQVRLASVETDDHGLPGGDGGVDEVDDQGAELRVGAVEAGLVHVTASGRCRRGAHDDGSASTISTWTKGTSCARRRTSRGGSAISAGIPSRAAMASIACSARWSMKVTAERSQTTAAAS